MEGRLHRGLAPRVPGGRSLFPGLGGGVQAPPAEDSARFTPTRRKKAQTRYRTIPQPRQGPLAPPLSVVEVAWGWHPPYIPQFLPSSPSVPHMFPAPMRAGQCGWVSAPTPRAAQHIPTPRNGAWEFVGNHSHPKEVSIFQALPVLGIFMYTHMGYLIGVPPPLTRQQGF